VLTVVTGGAGHLGTDLVASLRADGHDVRVVDLREPATGLALGATWVRADVRDASAMRDAFDGAAVVYHLAAVISVVGGLGGLVESVNVDGARTVAEAALATGVARLVHCSSVHAFDLAANAGRPVDESTPRCSGRRDAVYDRSKADGEAAVRRVVERGLDAVMVNPTGVVGPRDEAPSRMGSVLLALWRRRMPALVGGGFDWVDVRDVTAAMRAAAERGRTGESYLLPGHAASVRDVAALARDCSGVRVAHRVAPLWAVGLGAPAATLLARRTGNPLMPTREALRALRSFPRVDGAKAARELGHHPRPLARTIADLYQYFVSAGRLSKP
jgi:dihydroflavonol-4-reductase